jgi:hypothetical protein
MNLNLTINLPAIAVCVGMTRQERCKGPHRERISEEKYFRQAIQIYCKEAEKEGEPEDSGFVQLNDYTDMCKMIRVLPKHKQCLHAFDCWEHYELDFFKTEKFNVRDLTTGNFIQECFTLPAGMPHNDLEKNEDFLYSKVLLETLEEYSETNMPELVLCRKKQFAKIKEDKDYCSCKLLEYLDIRDAFTEDRINEEDKNKLQDNLTCDCEVETFAPEPTESELMQRAEFKVKARAEIAEMFIVKALAKTKTLLETKLSESYSGLAVISEEIIHALKQVFVEKQKAQDGPEIEKAFIEKEVERLTREILKRV